MKKFKSVILLCLVLLLIIPTSAFAIDNENSMDSFLETVRKTKEFELYGKEKMSLSLKKEILTEQGIRKTAVYETVNGKKTLVFVADINNQILFSGLIDYTEDNVVLTDLANKTSELLNRFTPNSLECSTYTCVEKRTRTHVAPAPGCNSVVGSGCKPLTLIPNYGLIAYAVCRAGVFIACLEVSHNEICTRHDYVPYCEW